MLWLFDLFCCFPILSWLSSRLVSSCEIFIPTAGTAVYEWAALYRRMNAYGLLWHAESQCLVTHAANKTPRLTSIQGRGSHIQEKRLLFFTVAPRSKVIWSHDDSTHCNVWLVEKARCCSRFVYKNEMRDDSGNMAMLQAVFTLPGWSNFHLYVIQIWYFQGCLETQVRAFQIRLESFSRVVLDRICIRVRVEWQMRTHTAFWPRSSASGSCENCKS